MRASISRELAYESGRAEISAGGGACATAPKAGAAGAGARTGRGLRTAGVVKFTGRARGTIETNECRWTTAGSSGASAGAGASRRSVAEGAAGGVGAAGEALGPADETSAGAARGALGGAVWDLVDGKRVVGDPGAAEKGASAALRAVANASSDRAAAAAPRKYTVGVGSMAGVAGIPSVDGVSASAADVGVDVSAECEIGVAGLGAASWVVGGLEAHALGGGIELAAGFFRAFVMAWRPLAKSGGGASVAELRVCRLVRDVLREEGIESLSCVRTDTRLGDSSLRIGSA